MNNLLRGLISGYGAYKLGGGCLGTIVVFVIIWLILGQCNWLFILPSGYQDVKWMSHQQVRWS